MKYKAENGGRSNPATHTPIGDPSLDAGFSSLSIKTSSNQPSSVNSHIWKRRFFLVATCRQLGSATAVLAFRGNSSLHTLTFRSVIPDIPKSFPISLLSGLGRSRRHCTPLFSLDPATISATNCHQGSLQADLVLPITSQNFLNIDIQYQACASRLA